ncbi:MAG TPA: glycosyltransferase family 9 protein, partial [Planctomycetota bacterium]|nr:glycosyltransferase family 9 protein [Planctomycetota bacterium]
MKRVLLVRLSAMGDLVQSLGAVRALAQVRPELELCVLTQRPLLPLLEGRRELAAVVPHDRRGRSGGLLATRALLRRLGCDIALDLQGNWKSALLALLSGARQRFGAAGSWRQEPLSRWLLTRTVSVPGPPHPALVAHALVRAIAPTAPMLPPGLQASEAEIAAAAATVARLGIAPTRPFRVVVLADPADPRTQRPAALVREVAASELPVLLLAGPAEAQVAPPVAAPLWRQGAGELRQLVALGCLLARVGG